MAGSSWAFLVAILVIVGWLLSGPYYNYSDTWLIAISTITSVIVFLMVFSIQNTQNRDSKAIHIKLNELIAVDSKTRNELIGLEDMTDEELSEIDEEFKRLLTAVGPTHALRKLHKRVSSVKTQRAIPKRAS